MIAEPQEHPRIARNYGPPPVMARSGPTWPNKQTHNRVHRFHIKYLLSPHWSPFNFHFFHWMIDSQGGRGLCRSIDWSTACTWALLRTLTKPTSLYWLDRFLWWGPPAFLSSLFCCQGLHVWVGSAFPVSTDGPIAVVWNNRTDLIYPLRVLYTYSFWTNCA